MFFFFISLFITSFILIFNELNAQRKRKNVVTKKRKEMKFNENVSLSIPTIQFSKCNKKLYNKKKCNSKTKMINPYLI